MSIRLFGHWNLAEGNIIITDRKQTHYLVHVMRVRFGEEILLFNGVDGEWKANISNISREKCIIVVKAKSREQPINVPDIWLLFAPIKRPRVDLLAEKSCELGIAVLWPVFTQHTVVTRTNIHRLQDNVIKAAEQCGRLTVPEVYTPKSFAQVFADWSPQRKLIVCDQRSHMFSVTTKSITVTYNIELESAAIFIGPEGGFTETEIKFLSTLPFTKLTSLGPRTLRAETAGIAMLAYWQAVHENWGISPNTAEL